MARYEIIQAQGEVQMIKRDWWKLYKRGWQKHRDLWNRRWWIKFKWDAEYNVPQRSSVAQVRDYGAETYQTTLTNKRTATLKICSKPLLVLHFVRHSTLFKN